MERAMRVELQELSLEILGTKNRYQKLINKPNYVTQKDPMTGKDIKVATYMSAGQVLELLRNFKRNKEEQEAVEAVNQAAGTVGT